MQAWSSLVIPDHWIPEKDEGEKDVKNCERRKKSKKEERSRMGAFRSLKNLQE